MISIEVSHLNHAYVRDLKMYVIFVADASGLDRDTNEDNEGSMANQRNAPRNSISPNAAKEKAKKPFFKKVCH